MNLKKDIIKIIKKIFVVIFIFGILFGQSLFKAQAEVTEQDKASNLFDWRILFSGKLTDVEGNPVADGKYNVRFAIYDSPQGGDYVWEENFINENRIEVLNGNFQAVLGERAPINLDFNKNDYFLGVTIGGSFNQPIWDNEMLPRRKIITLEKLLDNGSQFVLSEGDLIDALVKEFESLKPTKKTFIDFIKDKLKAPDDSTIIVNLNTLQAILEKVAQIDKKDESLTSAQNVSGRFLDFFIKIINTLIEKITQIFEKIGQIFSSLMNISDKVDKIYNILSNTNSQSSLNSMSASLSEPQLTVTPTQAFGSAKIEPGKNVVFVEAPQISQTSKIFITFEQVPPFVWWISQKVPQKGFYLSLYPETLEEISFDWWIVNDINFKDSSLPSPTSLPNNKDQPQIKSQTENQTGNQIENQTQSQPTQIENPQNEPTKPSQDTTNQLDQINQQQDITQTQNNIDNNEQ